MAAPASEGPAGPPITLKSPLQRKQDVFDSEDFEPTKFINQIYPDEASLGDLDKFVDMLRKQVKAVDSEIMQAVRTQTGAQARSKQDLSVANSQIQVLFGRIRGIQAKAADTEALVQEICRDIRKLDCAKCHLTHTITSLRRLAMLTAAVDDLEQVSHRRDQYKRCANLLEAVAQLMEYFQQYQGLPKIASLTKRLTAVQQGLQDSVLDDFKLMMGSADAQLGPDNLERLSSACLVVNALGPKVRDMLMDWLAEREVGVYNTIFSMSNENARLERFERRFAWFKGRLEERKEVWGVFPEAWRVPQTLCLTFCKITKAALKRILSDGDSSVASDVSPLIRAVVSTVKFEREMAALFGGGAVEDEDDDLQDVDGLPASEARRRLEARRKRQQAAKAAAAAEAGGAAAAERAAAARVAFEGAISVAFEPALKHYVAQEQKELMSHLETLMKEEAERRWAAADEEGNSRVLSSANQLFLKIRASLTRCVKLVSRGQALLRLVGAFKAVLSAYAAELLRRLPKTTSGHTSVAPPFNGTDWHLRLPLEEEALVAAVLATAEYCRDTVAGLAVAIQKDIKPELADQVNLGDEEGVFVHVSSQCLSVLVLGINTRLDLCLQDMLRLRWDAVESPGDDSSFVVAARKVLSETAPRMGAALDESQLGFFCDKMGRMFMPRYVEAIYKLRRINEKGTLQLSIDTDSLRRALLDFPRQARPADPEAAASSAAAYCHFVEREMGTATSLAKVLQAKPENLVDTFILLMPRNAQTPDDLARVCELKGFTKKLQSELLFQFARKTGLVDSGPMQLTRSTSISGAAAAAAGAGAALLQSAASMATPGVSSGYALGGPNLSALKLSVNTFTRELASTMRNSGIGGGGSFDTSPNHSGREKPSAVLFGGGKSSGPSFNFNMQQTAARTREGFAKMANILPGKLTERE